MDLFGSSGTRGVVNEDLTPEDVTRIGMAAGGVFAREGHDRAALARDTRRTGPLLADAASAGLAAAGVTAVRVGMLPTPGLQAYAADEGIPGAMITASHNPPEYNGVKLVGADGVELTRDRLERVEKRLLGDDVDRAGWREVGRTERVPVGPAREHYRAAIGAAVDADAIADAGLRVAVDPGHGAAAATSPALFRELGCEITTVNAQPDGRFPGRDPEPTHERLADLRRLVRAADADLGVAHDGDGDRAVFVDETGTAVSGDAAFAALAADTLSDGDVCVAAVNVSQRVVEAVEDAGARLELTAIGSTNLISRARKLEARGDRVAVAGEGNGGVMFPDYRLARDGAYTAARVLELIADRPTSGVIAPHSGYELLQRNLPYRDDDERDRMLAAARRHADRSPADVNTIDGYRLDYSDGWVLVRPSGTEPVVRLYAEASDPDRARKLLEAAATAVEAA